MELDKSSKQAGRSEAGRQAGRQAVLSVILLLLAAIVVILLLLLAAIAVLMLLLLTSDSLAHKYNLTLVSKFSGCKRLR